MKRKSIRNLIFWSYFFLIFVFNKVDLFSFSWQFVKLMGKDLIFWLLGAFLGANFFKLVQLAKKYLPGFSFQKSFYSCLFQLGWLVLAFFTTTSTPSLFGKSLVMAIGLYLLLIEWESIFNKQDLSWLFWQIKREVLLKEQKIFIYAVTFSFAVLTILLMTGI